MHKIAVGVLGASGYAGRELCNLILGHPKLRLVFASANTQAGDKARFRSIGVDFVDTEHAPLDDAELIFSALPHGTSSQWVTRARATGAKVVDLSSDLRPGNSVAEDIPYGLTELMRECVRTAQVVANPGCYPTAVLIALAPLIKRKLTAPDALISISAASGVTGAGYSPRSELMFAEIAEDFRAYSTENEHRHLPEMVAVTRSLGSTDDFLFVPHLLPVARGILATMIVPVNEDIRDPLSIWKEAYSKEPFIEIVTDTPNLKDVARRNVVRIGVTKAKGVRRPTLIVIAAIDNLVKGAAGQAVQNANIMLGIDETLGLPA